MLRFIVRRVLLMIPTLFVISALVYFIIDLPPGDCVTAQVDELLSRGDPITFLERPLSCGLLIASAGLLLLVILPQFRKTREAAFQEAP